MGVIVNTYGGQSNNFYKLICLNCQCLTYVLGRKNIKITIQIMYFMHFLWIIGQKLINKSVQTVKNN